MASRIAELLFPANQHWSQGEPYSAYAARIKGLYHKQVLVPLRSCLDVPEVSIVNFMCMTLGSVFGVANVCVVLHQFSVKHAVQ